MNEKQDGVESLTFETATDAALVMARNTRARIQQERTFGRWSKQWCDEADIILGDYIILKKREAILRKERC